MVTVTTSGLVDRKSLELDGALNGIIDLNTIVMLYSQSVQYLRGNGQLHTIQCNVSFRCSARPVHSNTAHFLGLA